MHISYGYFMSSSVRVNDKMLNMILCFRIKIFGKNYQLCSLLSVT
jgi:hypothetical protein